MVILEREKVNPKKLKDVIFFIIFLTKTKRYSFIQIDTVHHIRYEHHVILQNKK